MSHDYEHMLDGMRQITTNYKLWLLAVTWQFISFCLIKLMTYINSLIIKSTYTCMYTNASHSQQYIATSSLWAQFSMPMPLWRQERMCRRLELWQFTLSNQIVWLLLAVPKLQRKYHKIEWDMQVKHSLILRPPPTLLAARGGLGMRLSKAYASRSALSWQT